MTLAAGAKPGVYEIVGRSAPAEWAPCIGLETPACPVMLPSKSPRKFSERFAREAHAIASLNHPNITTLYDVGPAPWPPSSATRRARFGGTNPGLTAVVHRMLAKACAERSQSMGELRVDLEALRERA